MSFVLEPSGTVTSTSVPSATVSCAEQLESAPEKNSAAVAMTTANTMPRISGFFERFGLMYETSYVLNSRFAFACAERAA